MMNAVSTMEDVIIPVSTLMAPLNVDVTVVTNSPAMEDTVLVRKAHVCEIYTLFPCDI